MGPEIEYAGEKPDEPIELRIYRGADGSFDLYEDEGDSYSYEKGARAITPIHWDDESDTLSIGARQGTYPGMPAARTFRIILVDRGHGVGARMAEVADKEIHYEGRELRVKLTQ
jgi:alpha-D-xyloside xylohydrolase